MSDDRLVSMLHRLGEQKLPIATDRAIRGRLETAWVARARRATPRSFGLRGFAAALAAFALVLFVVGFGGTALGASADSPLWDTRVTLETAGAFLRLSNDDRVAYLLDLVQSRTEEAARQEAAGNPGAAAKARAAASSAVVQLGGNFPRVEKNVPLSTADPSATPVPATPSPTSSPSPSPTPARTATAMPAHTVTPTAAPTATPTRTEPLRTPSQTPLPTATKQQVTIAGTVRDVTGTTLTGACMSTSPTAPTSLTSCIYQTKNGSYGFTVSITPGSSITLYAYYTDPTTGALSAGSATGTVTAPTTVLAPITLTPRR